jgi:probable phosphoglycerate mutase
MAVTHAGFMVWVFMRLFGVPRPGTGARVDFDFASVTEWEFSGGWRLVSLNLT